MSAPAVPAAQFPVAVSVLAAVIASLSEHMVPLNETSDAALSAIVIAVGVAPTGESCKAMARATAVRLVPAIA